MENNSICSSKLYLLKTKNLGEYYVIAEHPTEAQKKLEDDLNKAAYGYSNDREVQSISLLAKELQDFPTDMPNFSSGCNLLFA